MLSRLTDRIFKENALENTKGLLGRFVEGVSPAESGSPENHIEWRCGETGGVEETGGVSW